MVGSEHAKPGPPRRAVVTGGSGGLGRSIAIKLISDGWEVGLLDLPGSQVRDVSQELGAVPLPADVTNSASVDSALDLFGSPIGLLVNNAGVVRFGALLDRPTEEFELVLRVNLLGALIAAKAAVVRMPFGGSIVNVASKNGIHPVPETGGYGPSKAGLRLLTQVMALEWAHLGVRVNAVCPGALEDGMSAPLYADPVVRAAKETTIPAGRLGKAADSAAAVAFLAGEDSSYVTGQNLVVDGGVTMTILSGLDYRSPSVGTTILE
jgi:3-oxoacyl-[acyl-carrier protein] reductase